MILNEFALLASDTARTKAYLQAMAAEDLLPGVCIIYSDDTGKVQKEAEEYLEKDVKLQYFNLDIPVLYTVKKMEVPYVLVEDKDINSEIMQECLGKLKQKYLIYSGYGGYILKKKIFESGKKIIHVHAGILPQYRGSTTAYYSYLQEKIFGVTAIFLNEKIDEGEIIMQNKFPAPDGKVDIDYVYEPYIRAKTLIRVLKKYVNEGWLASKKQSMDDANTYFIIHPVLKHLALLSMGQKNEK